MILDIKNLHTLNFAISAIKISHMHFIKKTYEVNNRLTSGFCYILSGNFVLDNGEKQVDVGPNSIIYLPKGGSHQTIVTSECLDFFKINFELHVNGEFALFSKSPYLVTENAPPKYSEKINIESLAPAVSGELE